MGGFLSDQLRFSVGARLQLTHPTPGNFNTLAVHVGDINGDGHSDFVTRVASAPHHTTVAVLLSHAE